ncbi:MAG: SDR family NAD(P)-dependent oxidoreductase [Treponema sp.]|nr:SDR family NAD(P)-dependent oxidoreductase [Treponema sp.]
MTEKVLITGADRGLGLAACKVFLADGWEVFAGQFMAAWPELGELAGAHGDKLHIIPLDVSSDASVDAALLLVQERTSYLNVILNVAGLSRIPKETGIDFKDGTVFERPNFAGAIYILNTNTFGPMRVNNRFIPLLLKAEGDKTIVNISSEAGSMTCQTVVREHTYAYCMSKAAVNMQSHILQNSLVSYGVKVLAVDPGYLRSYITGRLNLEATVEPADSAGGILNLIKTQRDPRGHQYFYFDGRKMQY